MGRPPLGNKQRQIPVALPAAFRTRLEEDASNAGHSVAQEIRRRLERSFVEDTTHESTREFFLRLRELTHLVVRQTGYDWYAHPEAWKVLRVATIALLERFEPTEPLQTEPKQQPKRLVTSNDPEKIGLALEALSGASINELELKYMIQDLHNLVTKSPNEDRSKRPGEADD